MAGLSYDFHFCVGSYLDDRGSLCLGCLILTITYYIVYLAADGIADVVETGRRSLSTYIGRGRDNGFLKLKAELTAKSLPCDSDAYTPVISQ